MIRNIPPVHALFVALALAWPLAAAESQKPAIFEASLAGARRSPFATILGTEYRSFLIVGLRAGWPLVSGRAATLTYLAEVVPVAVSTNHPRAYYFVWSGEPMESDWDIVPRHSAVIAAGVSPIGIRANLRATTRVALFLDATGGMLAFSLPVPDESGRRLNYTASAGAGVELSLTNRFATTIGYQWHHTSNGGTAPLNYGLDAHMLRIGFLATDTQRAKRRSGS